MEKPLQLDEAQLEVLRACSEAKNFTRWNEMRATPEGAQIWLEGADVSGWYLRGANLSKAKLARARLAGANMSEANLGEADLRSVIAIGTCFDGANLSEASLHTSNLERASAMRTNFDGARFIGTNCKELVCAEHRPRETLKKYVYGIRKPFPDGRVVHAILRVDKKLDKAALKKVIDETGVLDPASNLETLAAKPGARKSHVDNRKTTFSGTLLNSCNFARAKLDHLDLSSCDISDVCFDGAAMCGVNLSRVALEAATFRKADLAAANIRHATCTQVDFSGANLERAILTSADLGDADFTNTHLAAANLEDVDLRHAKAFEFDSNLIRSSRTPPLSKDRWSVLRRGYSESRSMFHLLLLAVFFIPLIVKTSAFWWLSVLSTHLTHGTVYPNDLNSPSVAQSTLFATDLSGALAALGLHAQEYPMWALLFGYGDGGLLGVLAATGSIGLLLYNILRAVLTWFITALRDEEIRSGCTPARGDYERFYSLHRVAKVLWIVAITSLLIELLRLIVWLGSPVILLRHVG